MAVILDTSYLIAYVNKRDVNHHEAHGLRPALAGGKYGRLIITDLIFSEFVTLLRKKARDPHQAVKEGELLLHDPALFTAGTSSVVFSTAWELFKRYPSVSFTDAATAALAQRMNIQHVCSFDRDFDRFPFLRRVH